MASSPPPPRVWLTMHSTAQDIPADIAFEVASILIEWSRFENGIVADTASLMRYPAVRALTEDAPRNFKNKIDLWKKSIITHFAGDAEYRAIATEICSAGKITARHRHRLVHGSWRPSEPGEEGVYQVSSFKGLDVVEEMEAFWVDLEYLVGVHKDIRAVTDAFFQFMTNRMMHAASGLAPTPSEP